MIDLWVEGYAATGEHGRAQHLGSWAGPTYREAVLQWHQSRWTYSRYGNFELLHNGRYAVWGCEIFDNEEDARRSFG